MNEYIAEQAPKSKCGMFCGCCGFDEPEEPMHQRMAMLRKEEMEMIFIQNQREQTQALRGIAETIMLSAPVKDQKEYNEIVQRQKNLIKGERNDEIAQLKAKLRKL